MSAAVGRTEHSDTDKDIHFDLFKGLLSQESKITPALFFNGVFPNTKNIDSL